MADITVTAKATLGYSPAIGQEIIEGETYTISAEHWSADLFHDPAGAPPAPVGADNHDEEEHE